MSRGVIFDKFASQYAPETTLTLTQLDPELVEQEIQEEDRLKLMYKDNLLTTRLSGPQEPSSDHNTSRPSPGLDKGKAKMPEYEDPIDNESTHSLDSEFKCFDI